MTFAGRSTNGELLPWCLAWVAFQEHVIGQCVIQDAELNGFSLSDSKAFHMFNKSRFAAPTAAPQAMIHVTKGPYATYAQESKVT